MYLAAFLSFWWLGRQRARISSMSWGLKEIDDLLFYGAIGAIVGGRLGYVLFYDSARIVVDPLFVFRVWEGGMSFHGGFLGVLVALLWFGRNTARSFFVVADFVAPLIPIGLAFGRLGNFINNELWGKPTELPWGILVPGRGDLPLHPSQLYQAGLEGVTLFVVLWFYSSKTRPAMAVSALFLIGYGSFRFLVEFVRMPDINIGYLAFDWLTMGQVLSVPMVIGGVVLILLAYKNSGIACSTQSATPIESGKSTSETWHKRNRK